MIHLENKNTSSIFLVATGKKNHTEETWSLQYDIMSLGEEVVSLGWLGFVTVNPLLLLYIYQLS